MILAELNQKRNDVQEVRANLDIYYVTRFDIFLWPLPMHLRNRVWLSASGLMLKVTEKNSLRWRSVLTE